MIWIFGVQRVVNELTEKELYNAGRNDASTLGSPQCSHPKYLEGWEALEAEAHGSFDENLDLVIEQRNFWGLPD